MTTTSRLMKRQHSFAHWYKGERINPTGFLFQRFNGEHDHRSVVNGVPVFAGKANVEIVLLKNLFQFALVIDRNLVFPQRSNLFFVRIQSENLMTFFRETDYVDQAFKIHSNNR